MIANPAAEKSNPLVSVVIPAYNQGVYLSEALDSLIAQSYSNWEATIVDDGSPDNVESVARNYCFKDSRIKFYHTDNRGVSAARNFAVSKSDGEFVLPLDADDKIAPTYIEKCVRRFQDHPETRLVYCRCMFFGKEQGEYQIAYTGYKNLLVANSIFCTAMFRKADFEACGGYDENMVSALEDWEFLLRLLDDEAVVYQIPELLFFYRIKDKSRNNSAISNQREIMCFDYIYNKHQSVYVSHFGHPLIAANRLYYEAQYWRRKYKDVWYRRFWQKIRCKDCK